MRASVAEATARPGIDGHAPERANRAGAPPRYYYQPRLSPDGRRVALDTYEGNFQVWIYDLLRDQISPFTYGDERDNRHGLWTPDSSRLVYQSGKDGTHVRTYTDIACMEAANEAARRAVNCLLAASGASHTPASLWPLEEAPFLKPLQEIDRIRYRLGLPHHLDVLPSLRDGHTR